MNELYTVDEILDAINDLEANKKENQIDSIKLKKTVSEKIPDIPSNTLKLIEEAEKTIKLKLQSE